MGEIDNGGGSGRGDGEGEERIDGQIMGMVNEISNFGIKVLHKGVLTYRLTFILKLPQFYRTIALVYVR
jgi:hypothetical protein